MRYVLTITGAATVEEALTFYCDQVAQDYGVKACRHIVTKGFKRVLMTQPALKDFLECRLSSMHMMSESEFIWMGHDDKHQSIYVVYGLIPDIYAKVLHNGDVPD